MQSYLYNDDPSYSDDERYDEEQEADDTHIAICMNGKRFFGHVFTYPSYEDNEDMM